MLLCRQNRQITKTYFRLSSILGSGISRVGVLMVLVYDEWLKKSIVNRYVRMPMMLGDRKRRTVNIKPEGGVHGE